MSTIRIRSRLALSLSLLASLMVLCGCAHQYLMKLSNGGQIISISKPKLEGTHYHFRNNEGQECVIPQDRVVKIEAGAVQTEEKKPAPPTRPKQSKHWYLLWLA